MSMPLIYLCIYAALSCSPIMDIDDLETKALVRAAEAHTVLNTCGDIIGMGLTTDDNNGHPVDKGIRWNFGDLSDTTQENLLLYTALFPSTFTGLQVDITQACPLADSLAFFMWAIVFVPDGETVKNLSISSNTDIYEPQEYVLACGAGQQSRRPMTMKWRGHAKGSQKLHVGDRIYLCVRLAVFVNATDWTSLILFNILT